LKLVAAGGAVAMTARSANEAVAAGGGLSAAQDERILQFALTLEELKAAFYREASAKGKLSGELRRFAAVAGAHEQDHVDALARALGQTGRRRQFAFGDEVTDPRRFTVAAIALEEAAVGAYNGQAANLRRPALALALKIVSVEGRHAAWIRSIAGKEPVPRAADPGEEATTVLATLKRIQHG
jgi:rubrerythrin